MNGTVHPGVRLLRIACGLALLAAGYFPAGCAYGLAVLLAPGGPIGANQHLESWSPAPGLFTLRGWQLDVGLAAFAFAAMLMLGAGLYLVLSKPSSE